MKNSLKQYDIEDVIMSQYKDVPKSESIKHIRTIFGNTAAEVEIQNAYNALGK